MLIKDKIRIDKQFIGITAVNWLGDLKLFWKRIILKNPIARERIWDQKKT